MTGTTFWRPASVAGLAVLAGVVTLAAQNPAPAANPNAAPAPGTPDTRVVESNGPTPAKALIVGEKSGAKIAIIDTATLKVVAKVPVGNSPHELAAIGNIAYAGTSGVVSVVDVVAQRRLSSIEPGARGGMHGLWAANGKLYMGHEQNRILSRWDPATQKFDWTYGTGASTHLLTVSDDERTIHMASSSAQALLIMQQAAPAAAAPPAVAPAPAAANPPAAGAAAGGGRAGGRAGGAGGGGRAGGGGGGGGGGRGGWTMTSYPMPGVTRMEGFDVSADGQEFWGLDINGKKMYIHSIPDKKLIETFDLPTEFTNRIRLTRDGKYAVMNELNGNELFIFDAATRKEVKRIEVGGGGEGIMLDPDGTRAYYAVSRANKLAVIDLKTLTLVGEVPGLLNPDGMAWYNASPASPR